MERIRCEYESKQDETSNFGHVGHGFVEFSDDTVSLISLAPSVFKELGCIHLPASGCSEVCCLGCASAVAYVLFALLFLHVLPKTRTTFPIALVSEIESKGERVSFAAQHPRTSEKQTVHVRFRTATDSGKALNMLGTLHLK